MSRSMPKPATFTPDDPCVTLHILAKKTCGKIGEEVLMRSFSLGSHRSSQPSSTRNSWLFAYVNRGRDFLEEFSTIGKGPLWDMISNLLCMNHRAAKFTKNKNDQWNHAGGFATNISTSLSLKMQPQRDWLTCGARCVGSEPPKCRRPDANGILRVRIWTA